MKELIYWVAFNHLTGIGPVRFQRLLDTFGTASAGWNASEKDLEKCLGPQVVQSVVGERNSLDPEKMVQKYTSEGIGMIPITDDRYPELLKTISHPPFLLYQRGDFDFRSHEKYVAIVGTRRASQYGRKVVRFLARELAQEGWVIVSGLALGIDGEAHRGALEGGGHTIAVLGTGVEVVYPGSHRGLAHEIIDRGGALVSEFVPSCGPQRENFPVRNRIISGLSLGVLVAEAPRKSGALITTDFALEQGREVMAVPGSIFSPASEGTNQLIAQGAKLVQNIEDVVEALGFLSGKKSFTVSTPPVEELNEEEKELFSFLDYPGLYTEEFLQKCGWEPGRFYRVLLSLEMKKVVQTGPGGKICLS
ncbi:MAG: DNA-processing protein DprA [Atribacterota bacterium]